MDLASLFIKVDSGQLDAARRKLNDFTNAGGKAEHATNRLKDAAGGLGSKLAAIAASVGAATAAMMVFRQAVERTAQFQGLQAGLITATGSVENATEAFKALQVVAVETPYDLAQVVTAFTKLVNYGLEPSKRALMAYGDTASSMNKRLEDMIEAVADAATGEFERLKEFGIKAKQEGDKVTFVFRGVATEVKKNAKDIENYLINLGEQNFAGGMARQMDTMGGAISNVKDAWDVFLVTMMETSGVGGLVEDVIRAATAAISDLTAEMESGAFQSNLEAWRISMEGFSEAWTGMFSRMRNDAKSSYEGLYSDSTSFWDDFIAYLQGVGPSVTALVEDFAVRLWGIVDAIASMGKAAYKQLQADMEALGGIAAAGGTAIAEAFKGNFQGAWEGFTDGVDDAMEKNIADTAALEKEWANARATNEEVVAGEVEKIWGDLEDRLDRQRAAREQARQQREDFGVLPAKGEIPDSDPLAKFRVGGDGSGAAAAAAAAAKKGSGASKANKDYERLVKELQSEEEAFAASYAERLAIIDQFTKDGSALEGQMSLALVDEWEKDSRRYVETLKRDEDTLWEGLQAQNDLIKEAYERRREIILNITEITEAERLELLKQAEDKYSKELAKSQRETASIYLEGVEGIFADIASIGDAFGKKGFEIAKAAAIAQATIKMYESAVNAYASLSGIPYVGPVLGAAAAAAALAAGAANIASIKAQKYSGAYAEGGMIPAGSFGLVGEAGPEIVHGPAVVTSARATADKGAAAARGNVIINISNYSGQPVEQRTVERGDDKLIELIVGQAERRVADNILRGGTPVARAIETTYPVRRAAR